MQFITNGPEVPEALLQAQEEGRMVLFCGSGISCPAGLPGFKGLVDEIYRLLGTTKTLIEQEAYDRERFDATLDLLEHRLPGPRVRVRQALAEALKPDLTRVGSTDTHAALLQLAQRQDGGPLRIVTTNFDRIFEEVASRFSLALPTYPAPLLPIPKSSRWNGLVYLHGLLPGNLDESSLNRLVVTSGDFGLAYLTERWASRFVSELFRNYVVCFVGYGINDPVLRYMLDALAADRMLGESTPQAFAFADCPPGEEKRKNIEWGAKRVSPILYDPVNEHDALHASLRAWAGTWRDGILGRERIVVEYAITRPSGSTQQDNYVGRMLWALSHPSGLPAKLFAEFDPVPALEWLDVFSEDRFKFADLDRFGVPPLAGADEKLAFSLVQRPAPYPLAPRMALASMGAGRSGWDEVMLHLARWLMRHLNDPKLILWLAQRGGHLHPYWIWLIKKELDRIELLLRDGKTSELEEIQRQAPNAIPDPLLLPIWRLLLTGRVKSFRGDLSLYQWKDQLKRKGLGVTARFELRDVLAPKISLKEPIRWTDADAKEGGPRHLKQLLDWELVLSADHVHSALRDLTDAAWIAVLPDLQDELEQLLRDALDLMRELGEANDLNDRSHWDMPSISRHRQNRGFRDWVALIELLRESWLALRAQDPGRASRIAQAWFYQPYPTFKRLALFAASHQDCIAPEQWVDWLLADDAWWLWTQDTKRESMRLLVLQGMHLTGTAKSMLEAAILQGPPRRMYRDGPEPDWWQGFMDHSVWLRLAKMESSGIQLGETASSRFQYLSSTHPDWILETNESDEFSHWMSGTGDPDFVDRRRIDTAPRTREDIVQWIKQTPTERHPFEEDNWQEVCRSRFFHALYALCDLSREGIWPMGRWREALQVWSEDGQSLRAWRFAAPLVQSMPDETLDGLAHSVTWWLEVVSKSVGDHEEVLLDLCHRILGLQLEPSTGILQNGQPIDEPVTEAINHPIGQVAQVLLNLWLRSKPNDNDLLPASIQLVFTRLCDTNVKRYIHGRVLLAANLISLYRVDRAWTEAYLLPLFDWVKDPKEAKAVWEGFLWSPRLYRPLLIAIKPQFLETVHHYQELGEDGRRFATFLTYAALEMVDGYSPDEFQKALEALPEEGLREAAQALSQALEGAGEQREEYWRNRVLPFWHQIWPKSRDLASMGIAESLARLCVSAGTEFPSALAMVQDWLQPIEHPYYVMDQIEESGLCSKFPFEALHLLSSIIDAQPWVHEELGKCLAAISQAEPSLAQDAHYLRLEMYRRQSIR